MARNEEKQPSTVARSMDSGANRPGLKSQLCRF